MSSDLLGTAITGLRVSQGSLSTTGHNIANAGVDGYSRQRLIAGTNPATPQYGQYLGNGANIVSIERQVNDFLVRQLRIDTTLHSGLDVYEQNISQLDSLLSDASTGMSGAFESFFAAMQNGADDPTSIPARQLIISESENLADRFNTIYGRLVAINEGLNSSLETAVAEVNALVKNIAELNSKIADAKGAAKGEPNDLLDQRDQALKELAKYVSYQTYEQGFGELNILIASGQNLVVGSRSREIALVPGEDNPSDQRIVFIDDAGQRPLEDDVLGGEIGGLFRFRDDVLKDTYNELGRIAVVMADTFNRQNATGITLDNDFGGDFFADVNTAEIARARVIASDSNALPDDRILRLNIADVSQLQLSDYRVEMVNNGLYSITRSSDGQEVLRSALPGYYPFSAEFDGLELVFERGSFQGGDQFLLQPVRDGARDFASALTDPSALAFGLPLSTDSSLSNAGSAAISPGQVLSLTDIRGDPLPLFAQAQQMSPPLLVHFISDTVYEILDNSDPGSPVALDPPISNRLYIPGAQNLLFGTDPGETLVQMNGAATGLPVGSAPVIGGGALANAYPAETISFIRASSVAGGSPSTQNVAISANASARTTASLLNNIEGVNANASTYAEISNTQNLTLVSPLQITLNGQDLIEYEFDSGSGTFVVASNVPDPALDEAAFNDYLESQINSNSALRAAGIFATAAVDAATGAEELRLYSRVGDNLDIALIADNTGPDSLSVGDGNNPAVILSGNGVGVSSAIAVGGTIDLQLAEGLALSSTPALSALFGDTAAADFARETFLGIQASIRGNPARGDVFTLDFNLDAASDNRNALALADLEAKKIINKGTTTYTGSYGSLVETIGIETSSTQINRDAAKQVLQQSEDLRNSVSAVNLDEEAADLIRFEQMYSANAQVISVARNLFDTLIGSF